MNFFSKMIAATKPSPPAPVPPPQPEPQKPWVICFGASGRRIWLHLITYDTSHPIYPLAIDDANAAHFLWKTIHPEKTLIISRVDDILLWRFIKLTERTKNGKKGALTGYFLDPANEQPKPNDPSVRNLAHAKNVFDQVTVYKIGEKQDVVSEIKWLDEKMDTSEKLIVLEILKINHPK